MAIREFFLLVVLSNDTVHVDGLKDSLHLIASLLNCNYSDSDYCIFLVQYNRTYRSIMSRPVHHNLVILTAYQSGPYVMPLNIRDE